METKDLILSKEDLEFLTDVSKQGYKYVVFCKHHYRAYKETKVSYKHSSPILVQEETPAKTEVEIKQAFLTKAEGEAYVNLFPITTIDSAAICYKYTNPVLVEIETLL